MGSAQWGEGRRLTKQGWNGVCAHVCECVCVCVYRAHLHWEKDSALQSLAHTHLGSLV